MRRRGGRRLLTASAVHVHAREPVVQTRIAGLRGTAAVRGETALVHTRRLGSFVHQGVEVALPS
eukprot:9688125-Alexandrium_andersonii.AAC.1